MPRANLIENSRSGFKTQKIMPIQTQVMSIVEDSDDKTFVVSSACCLNLLEQLEWIIIMFCWESRFDVTFGSLSPFRFQRSRVEPGLVRGRRWDQFDLEKAPYLRHKFMSFARSCLFWLVASAQCTRPMLCFELCGKQPNREDRCFWLNFFPFFKGGWKRNSLAFANKTRRNVCCFFWINLPRSNPSRPWVSLFCEVLVKRYKWPACAQTENFKSSPIPRLNWWGVFATRCIQYIGVLGLLKVLKRCDKVLFYLPLGGCVRERSRFSKQIEGSPSASPQPRSLGAASRLCGQFHSPALRWRDPQPSEMREGPRQRDGLCRAGRVGAANTRPAVAPPGCGRHSPNQSHDGQLGLYAWRLSWLYVQLLWETGRRQSLSVQEVQRSRSGCDFFGVVMSPLYVSRCGEVASDCGAASTLCSIAYQSD